MINKSEYEKAYLELYELIKRLPLKDRIKIPNDFIEFLKDNMNSNYTFEYDESKNLLDQDIMVETKALLVQLYKKFSFSRFHQNKLYHLKQNAFLFHQLLCIVELFF